MTPEFMNGERSCPAPVYTCTECGADCDGSYEWEDGSGYFCDLCEAKDHYNYNLETDKRIITILVRGGRWSNIGWHYGKMHEEYDAFQREIARVKELQSKGVIMALGKEIKFFPVYSFATGEKIGEIKYDGYRVTHKWTALNASGRIKDCETQQEAERLVREAH